MTNGWCPLNIFWVDFIPYGNCNNEFPRGDPQCMGMQPFKKDSQCKIDS